MDDLNNMLQEIEAMVPQGQAPPPIRGAPPVSNACEEYDQPDELKKGFYDNLEDLEDPTYATVPVSDESAYQSVSDLKQNGYQQPRAPVARPNVDEGEYMAPDDGFRGHYMLPSNPNPKPPQGIYSQPRQADSQRRSAKPGLRQASSRRAGAEATTAAATNAAVLPRNCCALCRKPVTGQMIQALGLSFHEDHFQCIKCERSLADITFFAESGMPYCGNCHSELHSPKCGGCQKPISGSCVKALDKHWHTECFVCSKCKKDFGATGYFPKDNAAVCKHCYEDDLSGCLACHKPIHGSLIHAMGGQFHAECFVCFKCKENFPNNQFFEHESKPYCKLHFHEARGTICHGCMEPIVGPYLNALGQKWHPDHFTCSLCMKSLAKEKFRERKGEPYCDPCYIKMFGHD